jgi:hypothetical protein
VKNNGFHPWINTALGATETNWPVWVIPPAFEEMNADGPLYSDRTAITAVARRYIQLPMVP